MKSRSGVTLLEVLFAIGIVIIGILGVAALIPLALYHTGKGETADRGTVLGVSGGSDFLVMGMADPTRWRFPNGLPVFSPATVPNPPYLNGTFSPSGCLFVDPEFVAINGTAAAAPFDGRVFPYIAATVANEPRCQRITLLPSDFAPTQAIAAVPLWRKSQARLAFLNRDELVFDRPADNAILPIARYEAHPGADGQWGVASVDDNGDGIVDDAGEALAKGSDDLPIMRSFDGFFSWAAMLVPKRDSSGTFRNVYTMSTIVFHRRDPRMVPFIDTNSNNAYDVGEIVTGTEKLLDVAGMPGLGISGGEVTLQVRGASTTAGQDLELRDGDWIMLAGTYAPPSATPIYDFRWYQVVGLDDINESASPYTRTVVLQGADWQIMPGANAIVQAVVVPGVITVQDQIIELDSISKGIH